ncbi:FimV/HubP family polar landmark protein [Simiduia agarivorans]|uniref:Tfp pilus assembly protein FimV-like protein n=1 Tax=Simiduia agarivorans (strain DSM 21679 / JCM 13881 / BCRC 17597 / SA1) TaxID=1117647 RepID=K4KTP9_SIMAS|nr:FimV/HubP family polar landmark protein [Simiduia agarivorans]AFU97352.1 Tfp pilus assembly protein FimV-like protein [Simiduia agarivorans SA1 = DSM 21679]
MRLRKLALAVGATAALCSNLALALGLGEITLNSSLNQPLDAQIKLLQVRDLSEQEIIVKLASREAFETANVERLFFLSGIRFEVVLDDPANPHVRLTTQENVREPYLNFLIETQWPTGRMLREYTVLMDLPTFSERNQRAVTAPAQQQAPVSQAAPQVKPRPTVKAAQPAPAARPERPMQGGAGTYAVGAGDTLWEIALQARPDRSYSVQQTMLAIQRLNPDAFINGNINLLRKGQVLRLPAADDIASLSTRQAINEVAYQNSQWDGGAALDASRRSGRVTDGAGSREGRVQLSSGGATENAETGRGSGRAAALENELAITQEQLDAAQRENSDLRSRIGDLEEQIATMARLIEVSNDEMVALQQAMAKGEPLPESAPVEETAEQPAPEATPAPAAEPEQPKPAATTVVRQAQPEPGIVDMLIDNILYIGVAILALLGGLLFWRRKQAQEAEEQAAFDAFLEEDEPESEEQDFDLAHEPDFEELPEADEEPEESFEELETAEAETADVAGEADIYIAYGKYDQAEEMLLKALEREPGRTDITLKLLEVYAETQNLEAFDRHFAGVMDGDDMAAQQRGEELRASIPGAGEFDRTQVQPLAAAGAAGVAAAVALDDEDPLLSLAEEGAEDEVDPLLSLAEEGAEDDEFSALQGLEEEDLALDLDLDAEDSALDDLDFSLDGLDETPAPASDADLTEEFSLDLDDSDSATETEEFSLDLDDSGADSVEEEFSLDLDEAVSADDELALDLGDDDLNLDLGDLDEAGEQPAEEALSLDDEFELSLDAEPETELPAADESFDLSLEDEVALEAEAPAEEAFSLDDALSLDEPVADAAPETLDDLDAGDADTLTVEADDFEADANLGDMDLEALDQEMASLSADLDLDDDLSALDMGAEEPATDEPEEFDISADLGIENGADELPPLTDDDSFDEAMMADDEAADEDAELGFLADSDEVATKLDLARAYIDMGDSEGARDILSEVLEEGDDKQKGEAEELMGRIG